MNTFFTADTHFGHENIIKYCNRPFNSPEEMDETIIDNWNSIIKSTDVVYVLGDFAFHNVKKYTERLNGNINLILGNHDKKSQCEGHFCSIHDTLRAKVNGKYLWMSHYAHQIWPSSCYNSEHIFGHSHGRAQGIGKSFDVGIDTNNYFPYSYEEVQTKMKTLPNNRDLTEDKHIKYNGLAGKNIDGPSPNVIFQGITPLGSDLFFNANPSNHSNGRYAYYGVNDPHNPRIGYNSAV